MEFYAVVLFSRNAPGRRSGSNFFLENGVPVYFGKIQTELTIL
jgi:hypothetical protein